MYGFKFYDGADWDAGTKIKTQSRPRVKKAFGRCSVLFCTHSVMMVAQFSLSLSLVPKEGSLFAFVIESNRNQ